MQAMQSSTASGVKKLDVTGRGSQGHNGVSGTMEMDGVGLSGVLVGISPLEGLKAEGRRREEGLEGMPPLHLLVIEDDGPVRRACCEIAAGMGFVVVPAEDVPEARRVLKQRPIDLVLLDLMLPSGGGLTLFEEVKAWHPEAVVVVMTAFATVASAVEAMRLGAVDYLTKPFALEELTTVLECAAAEAVRFAEPAAA